MPTEPKLDIDMWTSPVDDSNLLPENRPWSQALFSGQAQVTLLHQSLTPVLSLPQYEYPQQWTGAEPAQAPLESWGLWRTSVLIRKTTLLALSTGHIASLKSVWNPTPRPEKINGREL